MNTLVPKSMPVVDKDMFHKHTHGPTGHTTLIAEREYATLYDGPEYIVLHEMGEFTVLQRSPGSSSYFVPNACNAAFTVELGPRYTTRNTAIERYTQNEYERLVWVRPSGRVDNLATRWRGEEWDYVSPDMTPDYAEALFQHHTIGSQHVEHSHLKQNRRSFPGDQFLQIEEEVA